MRAVATATEIDDAVRDFVHALYAHVRVEYIVLYGSYVNGKPDEWSDFDIAVISPDFEGMELWQRQDIIAVFGLRHDTRLSPIGFPLSEYHNPGRHSFLREIIRTGKVIYQAA
jgi:uncharacterized protein